MTLRTISTDSGLVLSKNRIRSSSRLWNSPSCKSLEALSKFTGEFLLQGTSTIGALLLFSWTICSSSLTKGTLPPMLRSSCTLRSILQLLTSSCAIFKIKSALGTVRPGHLTSTSRSLTGLTRVITSAYEISPALTSVPEVTEEPDLSPPSPLLSAFLPESSPSSRGRLRPSITSLAIPAQNSERPTSQSSRSPRLATPM
mmetsp:Transcript_35644/g.82813  ORF Transcript_35644/g.82813 Transcript_35644/m.82813 type:complete len:200 (+) Transcript_35644:546-1145(+)